MRNILDTDWHSSPVLRSADKGASAQLSVRAVPRATGYLKAVAKLDAPHAESIDSAELAQAIEAEFGLADALPLGCVATCHLGPPFEVHVLDLVGRIVEHYQVHQPLPALFERARSLALHDAYLTIEVYSDRLACVRADGTVVEIHQ
jgi:hypothetical protein